MIDVQHKQTPFQVCVNREWVTVQQPMTVAALLLSKNTLATRVAVSGATRFAVCGMGVCQECRVTVDDQPHQLACQVWCKEDMVIETGGENARD